MKTKLKLAILTFLNFLIPKSKNKIAFLSHPDYSDNSKAFYQYVSSNSDYRCIWFVSNQQMVESLRNQEIEVYLKNNLSGFFKFALCKYVVSSDFEHLAIKPPTQIHIGLHHGMPLKKIGLLLEDIPKDTVENYKKIDYTVSTSPFFQNVIQDVFGLDKDKVLVSGQPRNDFIFNSNVIEGVNSILNLNLKSYEKIIMYVPTFRKHSLRDDGSMNCNNILNLHLYDEHSLNDFLKKNNYLLIAKLHPAEQASIKNVNFSNIIMLDSDKLTQKQITLNETLNLVDLLITDYSSVYFDFMLLDKPLLFINTDEKEYSDTRGFIFEDIDFCRPGPKVNSLEQFIKETECSFKDSVYFKEERDKVNLLINSYIDNNSSERVFNSIFNDKKFNDKKFNDKKNIS